jgi:hypothetical protein
MAGADAGEASADDQHVEMLAPHGRPRSLSFGLLARR